MSSARSDLKIKAKLCENAERYDDMVKQMFELIKGASKVDDPLNEEERNLLSVAYKNVVSSRRSSWRVLSAKVAEGLKENQHAVTADMKKRVEDELNKLCGDVLGLLNDHLIPNPENVEAKIFYLKMKGDYHRYMVEICEEGSSQRDELAKNADHSYQEALSIAREKVPTTSPIRLGLALNYSVFFYEIKNSPNEACALAKSAFEDAMADIDGLAEEVYKDSTLIMQLLRDNLTLWKSDLEDEEEEEQVQADCP